MFLLCEMARMTFPSGARGAVRIEALYDHRFIPKTGRLMHQRPLVFASISQFYDETMPVSEVAANNDAVAYFDAAHLTCNIQVGMVRVKRSKQWFTFSRR